MAQSDEVHPKFARYAKVERGGDPPQDGGMEQRVARLEEYVGQLRVDVGVMRERLEHTATKTWILGGVVATLLGLLAACWWLAQTYLTPILQATGKH